MENGLRMGVTGVVTDFVNVWGTAGAYERFGSDRRLFDGRTGTGALKGDLGCDGVHLSRRL